MENIFFAKKIDFLEFVYNLYNRKTYIGTDPISFLYNWQDIKEREIIALLSSSLAFGQVGQIKKKLILL